MLVKDTMHPEARQREEVLHVGAQRRRTKY